MTRLGPLGPLLGFAFPPSLPPERLPALAGIASAAALAWTRRIRVGIGFLPAPLRNVARTAMEIATLCRLFPGRLVPGLGHGVQTWMRQAGARVESPLTLLGEYATALRRLLAGEQVTTNERYVRLDGVRLDRPPDPPPPLLLGGAGPRSLAAGDAAQIAARVNRLAEAVSTSVVITPTADEPDLDGLVGFLGSAVRPLLHG